MARANCFSQSRFRTRNSVCRCRSAFNVGSPIYRTGRTRRVQWRDALSLRPRDAWCSLGFDMGRFRLHVWENQRPVRTIFGCRLWCDAWGIQCRWPRQRRNRWPDWFGRRQRRNLRLTRAIRRLLRNRPVRPWQRRNPGLPRLGWWQWWNPRRANRLCCSWSTRPWP